MLLFVFYTVELTSPCVCNQVTPAQIREAEKSLKIMEAMIEAMTPGLFISLLLIESIFDK